MDSNNKNIVITSAVRTAIGTFRGSLKDMQASDLGTIVTKAAMQKSNLNPDDVVDGTYTITNVGVFDTLAGIPIINQPQVGILAIGSILKKPSVIETEKGDFIGIRRKMILCHSYDHRIINGATGGLFIKRIKDIIEGWNPKTQI